jgi:transcriptional regulator GlxA family with amidase domain
MHFDPLLIWAMPRGPQVFARQTRRYRQIIDRIETIVRRGVGEPLHVADLCRVAAVSERTLRNAFHKVHGVSPYRYMRAFRLTQARQALLSSDVRPGAITQIAMQFGFLELGRFAVDYRSAFGESPSATLRRSPTARRKLPARVSRGGARTAYADQDASTPA